MGNTKDYLDYLNNEVGIAPAASQEELDLAQALANEYAKHGLDPEVQEFPAASLASLPYGIFMALVFVGMILVGIGTTVLTVVGLLLVAASIALLALTYTGGDVLSKFGPRAHSQNVVAVHRAEGEGNDRNRPIVILAHYDTPRVDLLSSEQFAPAKKYLPIIAPKALCVVAVCTFIQILVFLPEAARRTFWVIGIVAALPVLLWGIALIARRFSAYADGAVGNKSSVAAMLGVMDRVCAGDKPVERKVEPVEEPVQPVENSIVRPATRMVTHTEVEEVVGTRHGEAVLRSLGILPEECDITYIAPEVHTYEVEEPVEYDDLPVENLDEQAEIPAEVESAENVEAVEDADATVAMGPVETEDAPEDVDPDATRPMNLEHISRLATGESIDVNSLSQLEDGEATDEGPLSETDHSGLNTMVAEDAEEAAAAPRTERAVPAAVEDPEWGKSSFEPKRSGVTNVARRAALFDLPDVGEAADGLEGAESSPATTASYGLTAPSTEVPTTATPSPMAQRLAEASAQVAAAPAPIRLESGVSAAQFVSAGQNGEAMQDNIEVLSAPVNLADTSAPQPKRRGIKGLFGRKRKQQDDSMSEWLGVEDDFNAKTSGENIGSWANFENDDSRRSRYKGGAARNINLRNLVSLPKIGESDEDAAAGDGVEAPAEATSLDAAVTAPMAPIASPNIEDDEQGLFTEAPVEATEQVADAAPGEVIETADPVVMPPEEDGEENIYSPDADEEVVAAAIAETEEEPELEPIDRTLRDAILNMDNEELKAHDVWFVATGASELGHTGVNEFIAAHRKDLRGAFIINLESVGAGDLTALTYEGYGRSRRADRRLVKLISSIASDIHLDIDQLKRTWADTEATPCMRKSMRAVTLMGMGNNELPAYSATPLDSPEVIDEDKVVDVVAIINEVIKRS